MSALPRFAAHAGTQLGRDAAPAVLLTAAGLIEVLAGAAGDGGRLVGVVTVACTTLPLAWRRTLPLLPPVAIAITLIVLALFDDSLVGQAATPLVALVIALYSAGRHVESRGGLAVAALCVAAAAGTRIATDAAAQSFGQALLTVVALGLPLLVGRWVRGQTLLQRRLVERAERIARDRERDARDAAEEERMRIAGDLEVAIAGRLQEVVHEADALPAHLEAGDQAAARALLASIATTARDALADVRRVLGILRRPGEAPPLTPQAADAASGAGEREAPALAATDDVVPQRAPAPRIGARALDRLLVGALLAVVALDLAFAAPAGDRLLAAATAVPIALPLLWRRHRPLLAGAGVLAGVALQSTLLDLDTFPVSDIAAVVCAMYAIGTFATRRVAVGGLVLAVAGVTVHAAIFYPDGVIAALLGGVAAPWTVGRVVRGHRLLTRAGRDEAARAERVRAREARAAVTAERMRVARELHDAVAHNISVIAIQAGGADGIVDRDPERTAQCAALIATVAREALTELGRLVGTPDADVAAPPSLAHVDALAARARDAGQPVELRVEGEPAALPGGVDLAAYRIVQEALTNTSKHAAGARAQVVVRFQRHVVEVEIADDGRGAAPRPARDGTGHGLIGIRERVALYGGTLDAGRRPSGGFRVHARLPIGGA